MNRSRHTRHRKNKSNRVFGPLPLRLIFGVSERGGFFRWRQVTGKPLAPKTLCVETGKSVDALLVESTTQKNHPTGESQITSVEFSFGAVDANLRD